MYKIPARSGFKTNLVHYLPSCHSTNEIAQQLVETGAENGTVVITDDQYAGKGQVNNSWESEANCNLTFSLVIRPLNLKAKDQFLNSMAVSLTIREFLMNYLPGEVDIKWPNDILFKKKKIAGILIESNLKGAKVESMIIGIGLNVNQGIFNVSDATSIFIETGSKSKLQELFQELYGFLMGQLMSFSGPIPALLRNRYHEALFGMGQKMKFDDGVIFDGVILGTDSLGRLVIQKGKEQHAYQNKEVKYIL